jgi:hypothetical protein
MTKKFGTHLPKFFLGVKRETQGVKKRYGGGESNLVLSHLSFQPNLIIGLWWTAVHYESFSSYHHVFF